MKLLIASDIHGSARFCRMLLERFAAEEADRLLGDWAERAWHRPDEE